MPILAGRRLTEADFPPPQELSLDLDDMPIMGFPDAVQKLCKWMRQTGCTHSADEIEQSGEWRYPTNLDAIPSEVIAAHLTDAERAALNLSPNYLHSREWRQAIQQTPLAWLASKMQLSSWQRDWCSLKWSTYVKAVRWLHTMVFTDRHGKQVNWFLDATRYETMQGHGRILSDRFYDAAFSFVLTDSSAQPMVVVSFDVVDLTARGKVPAIRIRQVQACQRKNRELFALGDDFFISIVRQLAAHTVSHGMQLVLVKGMALAKQYIESIEF